MADLTRADKAKAVHQALTERVWVFFEPDFPDLSAPAIRHEWSESRIMAEFWPRWQTEMRSRGFQENHITPEECINDWVITNWAQQIR